MAETETTPAGGPPAGSHGDRRDFLKWLSAGFLGLWAVGGAGALAAYLSPPKEAESSDNVVRVGRLADLHVGVAQLIRHGVKPFFVLRTDATNVVAMSAVCTHMRCILNYDRERKGLVCPCHDGRFDLNGNPLSGPPRRALPTYEVSVRAGEVFVRV